MPTTSSNDRAPRVAREAGDSMGDLRGGKAMGAEPEATIRHLQVETATAARNHTRGSADRRPIPSANRLISKFLLHPGRRGVRVRAGFTPRHRCDAECGAPPSSRNPRALAREPRLLAAQCNERAT